MTPLDLSGLHNAIESLDKAISYLKNRPDDIDEDIVQDSIVQRFKYTYELCWKLLQRWIKLNISPEDAEPRTRKDLFRLAAKKSMITDPQPWFDFSEARNHTAHTYNEEKAKYVFDVALVFLPAAKALYKELESHND